MGRVSGASMKKTRQQYRAAKQERLEKTAAKKAMDALRVPGKVEVNVERLVRGYGYELPKSVRDRFYWDQPFRCQDCGVEQLWTARQQKWWYEVAKGNVSTTAVRCLSCRRRERERKAAARKTHLDGLAKKGRVAGGARSARPPKNVILSEAKNL